MLRFFLKNLCYLQIAYHFKIDKSYSFFEKHKSFSKRAKINFKFLTIQIMIIDTKTKNYLEQIIDNLRLLLLTFIFAKYFSLKVFFLQ